MSARFGDIRAIRLVRRVDLFAVPLGQMAGSGTVGGAPANLASPVACLQRTPG